MAKIPYPLYHGTNEAAQICSDHFELEKTGSQSDPGDLGKGIYFHTRKAFSKMYGKDILTVKVNLDNPFIVDFDYDRDKAYEKLDELEKKWGSPVRGCAYYSTEEIISRAEKRGMKPGEFCWLERIEASERWREELKKQGYDGVIAHGYEGRNTTTVVVFDSEKIEITNCTPRLSKGCKICSEKFE